MPFDEKPISTQAPRKSAFLSYWPRPEWPSYVIVLLSFTLIALITYVPSARFLSNMALFYHYTVPIALITLFLLFLFVRRLRIAAVVIAVALLASFWQGFAGDVMANGPSGPRTTPPDLTLATYNWRSDNREFNEFAGWVRKERPDLVAIEETPDLFNQWYPQISDQYPYRPTGGRFVDVTLLSRYPIQDANIVTIMDRHMIHAVIKTPERLVDVYVIHPQTVTAHPVWVMRNTYLTVANASIMPQSSYVVAMGDFNASPWDPYYRRIVQDHHLHAEPRLFIPVTRILGNVMGAPIGATIDHILVSAKIHLAGCQTRDAMGSDHVPVICKAWFRS